MAMNGPAADALEMVGPGGDEAGYEWRREQLLEDGGEWPARGREPVP